MSRPQLSQTSRGALLSSLIDAEVLALLKADLSPRDVADLILEIVNPHRPLSTKQKARLAGVSERAICDRRARGVIE
jgi:hypothetical protein